MIEEITLTMWQLAIIEVVSMAGGVVIGIVFCWKGWREK